MKAIIMLLGLAIGFAANAQLVELPLCYVDSQYTQPGLYPSYDSLPCFDRGKCTQVSLQFVNFDSITYEGSKVKVESTVITGVANLPCGIKWYTSSYSFGSPDTIKNLGKTCFWLGGVTNDSIGLYKISITASLTTRLDILPTPVTFNINLDDYGYPLFLRVKDSADVCQAIDTTAPTISSSCTSDFIICTYDEFGYDCDTCGIISSIAEIGEIEAFQLYPNPAASSVNISFKANKSSQIRWQIVNMFGQEVSRATLDAIAGLNQETIDVSALPNGVYLFVADDGIHQQTQRFVVAR